MVGTVGQILGEAGVNIAGMQVSRDEKGGRPWWRSSVDSAIPAEVLDRIRDAIDADQVRGRRPQRVRRYRSGHGPARA